MKLKSILVALALTGMCVSVALAAPPPGKGKPSNPGQGKPSAPGQSEQSTTTSTAAKGKPPKTGVGCRPRVALVLKGTLATAPGAAGTSFSLTVTHANHHAAAYAKASQPTSILVDAQTVVRRQGKKALGDLVSGDRALVQARACKADLANGATPQLTATRIVAHPAAG